MPDTVVHPAGSASEVVIRRVATLAEYGECVAIQRETWGDRFTEYVSATVLRISQEMGGITAAAWNADGAMLGFVYGITGVRRGELAHWSDMLAVRPTAQRLGLGTRLKLFQRDALLPLGVRRMYWTYDPLVARNAHLNIQRLGATAAEYHVNYYGEDTGSHVHAGLGTDRFLVEWPFDAPAPRSASFDRAAPIVTPLQGGAPAEVLQSDADAIRILIPADIFAVLNESPERAWRWRTTTRAAFEAYLGRGYRVVGFDRGDPSGSPAYYLRRAARADASDR